MIDKTNNQQKSGILMHISSLPSNYGIGTFGNSAYDFVDFLVSCDQQYWQMLPLGVTGYGDSPYQCMSAFAGNINFIDLDILIEKNLLNKTQVENIDWGDDMSLVDYGNIFAHRRQILSQATNNFSTTDTAYKEFCHKNQSWLDNFCLFMALKECHDMQSFDKWATPFKLRDKQAIDNFIANNEKTITFYKIVQFWFFEQYFALKKYANNKGIEIIGDIPFYVAYDSADVWANPSLFELDSDMQPINVAGVPPDAFSDDGQLWGNPLYNYENMRKDNYSWWSERIEFGLSLSDVLRIDHFRAFDSYYAIPFPSQNARIGQWRQGEGWTFFNKLNLIDKSIIAEDLGDINDSVRQLIKDVGYPNMKVLQFAFDSNKYNDFLVHNHQENSVVYTGTHDNNTTKGWYKSASIKEKFNLFRYLPYSIYMNKAHALIKYAFSSKAKMIIIPMQDYLNLGANARMNTPSTLHNNWQWRANKAQLSERLAKIIKAFKQ